MERTRERSLSPGPVMNGRLHRVRSESATLSLERYLLRPVILVAEPRIPMALISLLVFSSSRPSSAHTRNPSQLCTPPRRQPPALLPPATGYTVPGTREFRCLRKQRATGKCNPPRAQGSACEPPRAPLTRAAQTLHLAYSSGANTLFEAPLLPPA